MPHPTKLWLDLPSGRVATHGPILHITWRRLDDPAVIGAADDALAQWWTTDAPGVRCLCVHHFPDGLPPKRTPENRAALLAHFEKNRGRVAAAAVVLEAKGFAASLIRSIIAGLTVAISTDVKVGFVDDLDAGLGWLAARAKGDNAFDAADALRALR